MIGGAEEIFVYTREDAKGPVINFTFAAWLAVRATERNPRSVCGRNFPQVSKRRRIFSTPPFANYAIPLIALLIARPLQHLHRATPSAQALFHNGCCYTLRSSSTTSFDPRHAPSPRFHDKHSLVYSLSLSLSYEIFMDPRLITIIRVPRYFGLYS